MSKILKGTAAAIGVAVGIAAFGGGTAESGQELDCQNEAAVAAYAAEQRDDGQLLSRVMTEIEELTEPESADSQRFTAMVGLVFGLYRNLSPDDIAELVYRNCKSQTDI